MSPTRRSPAPWCITLFRVGEIPIRVHLTLFLLLAYIAFIENSAGGSVVSKLLFVILLFGCVLLHELGHALTAKFFKIRTRDIVLYPFGGIAMLMEEGSPSQEFFIAIAGPMVNLVLALLCVAFSNFDFHTPLDAGSGIANRLFLLNLSLAFFNLIPALPMDGGRILRSLLAIVGSKKATTIATRVSQVICVLMGFFALITGNVILLLISFVVFSSAVQEHLRSKTIGVAIGIKVRDVMTDASMLQTFTHGTTISHALKTALKSLQTTFPVLHSNEVIGLIDREAILETAALNTDESYLAEHMDREFVSAGPDEDLSAVLDKVENSNSEAVVILEDNKFVGMLLKEKVLEYLLVQDVRRRSKENARLIDEEV